MGTSSKDVIQASTTLGSGCDVIIASKRYWDQFFQPDFCDWTFLGGHVEEYVTPFTPPADNSESHAGPMASAKSRAQAQPWS